MIAIANREQIKEMINTIWQRKGWQHDAERMSEWASFINKNMARTVDRKVLSEAVDSFSTDPGAREIGHLIGKVNTALGREKMEAPDIYKYDHKGKGPNLAPEIIHKIIEPDAPEKWHNMAAMADRMIRTGPESAKTEWHKTKRLADSELERTMS